MDIFLGWIIFSLAVGAIGSNRNIGFAGAFFLSLFLSPIIGLIFTLVSKSDDQIKFELLSNAKKQTDSILNAGGKSFTDELFKLKRLLDSGLITREEFEIEKENIKSTLPRINQERAWTYEELGLYRTYAKYADDKLSEIEAFKLTLKKNDKDFLTDIYNRQLAELYVETGENNKALEILEGIIKGTDNRNIIRDCIEQLCRIIIRTNDSSDEIAKNSYHIIKVQHNKFRNFSPMVDGLINEATEIMKEGEITVHNKSLPKAGRTWWQKLFGSE